MRHADVLIGRRAAERSGKLRRTSPRMPRLRTWCAGTATRRVCGAAVLIRELSGVRTALPVERFCLELLSRHRTLLVPGTAFGT
ncbi:hypothetical protein [Streptomyces sp. DHE17-7]|uniref:hypothetical protein n=1 Tax=Streptomyces sp. DHE17-7 TaxID=2759949 RepID=UPI0022EAA3C0|nr:hypothetical protein [Streptomyces sp. DHE17-7]MBJ6617603.1 hypothetical protein [Streptomyces sp. DHE17-7]